MESDSRLSKDWQRMPINYSANRRYHFPSSNCFGTRVQGRVGTPKNSNDESASNIENKTSREKNEYPKLEIRITEGHPKIEDVDKF